MSNYYTFSMDENALRQEYPHQGINGEGEKGMELDGGTT